MRGGVHPACTWHVAGVHEGLVFGLSIKVSGEGRRQMGKITGVSRMRRKESPGAWLQSFSLGVHVGVTFSALQKSLSPPNIYAYIYVCIIKSEEKQKQKHLPVPDTRRLWLVKEPAHALRRGLQEAFR